MFCLISENSSRSMTFIRIACCHFHSLCNIYHKLLYLSFHKNYQEELQGKIQVFFGLDATNHSIIIRQEGLVMYWNIYRQLQKMKFLQFASFFFSIKYFQKISINLFSFKVQNYMQSNSLVMISIILLQLQIVNSQIIFEQTFKNVKVQEILNFLPIDFVLEENKIIYITLSLFDKNNYATLQVCTKYKYYINKNNDSCIKDQNSIDFRRSIQYIRIMFDIDNQHAQYEYNALPFLMQDYNIKIQSLNNPSSGIVKVEIYDTEICYQPCQNNNQCVNGECQCQHGYSGYDCSIQLINIENALVMTTSQLYYFAYLDFKYDSDYLFQLSETCRITYSCSSKNPHLLEYDYNLDSIYLNISIELMQTCLSYYENEDTSYQSDFSSFIILRLLEPAQVQLVNQYTVSTTSLSMMGIVFGCVGGFILIVIGYCISKCRKDARQQEKKIAQEKDEKDQLNQCIPTFDYQSLIIKYPGLKDDLECLICLILFQPDDKVRLTYCTHIFHNLCIELWLTKHKTCPMCREPLEIKHIPNIILETHAQNQRTKSIHITEEILHLNKISHRLLGNHVLNLTPPIDISKDRINEEQPSRIEQFSQDKLHSIASHPYK